MRHKKSKSNTASANGSLSSKAMSSDSSSIEYSGQENSSSTTSDEDSVLTPWDSILSKFDMLRIQQPEDTSCLQNDGKKVADTGIFFRLSNVIGERLKAAPQKMSALKQYGDPQFSQSVALQEMLGGMLSANMDAWHRCQNSSPSVKAPEWIEPAWKGALLMTIEPLAYDLLLTDPELLGQTPRENVESWEVNNPEDFWLCRLQLAVILSVEIDWRYNERPPSSIPPEEHPLPASLVEPEPTIIEPTLVRRRQRAKGKLEAMKRDGDPYYPHRRSILIDVGRWGRPHFSGAGVEHSAGNHPLWQEPCWPAGVISAMEPKARTRLVTDPALLGSLSKRELEAWKVAYPYQWWWFRFQILYIMIVQDDWFIMGPVIEAAPSNAKDISEWKSRHAAYGKGNSAKTTSSTKS